MEGTGAVLVAAGLSSRMGDFKPLLPFGASTISLHLVTALREAGLDPIVVVTGHRAEDLEAHLSPAGIQFVRNERYRETQMLDSVKLGIRKIQRECGRILVMPMDFPAILPETFAQVLGTDADLVRACWRGKGGHPIVMRSGLAGGILDYQGGGGLKGAIEALEVAVCDVETEDPGVCMDVDTPEEYLGLLAWAKQRKGEADETDSDGGRGGRGALP